MARFLSIGRLFSGGCLGATIVLCASGCVPRWKQTPHDRGLQKVRETPIVVPFERDENSDWGVA